MSIFFGDDGGIALVPETTFGTYPGTPVLSWLHAKSASLGARQNLITPDILRDTAPTPRVYGVQWADGDIVVAMDASRADYQVLYDLFGSLSVDDYTFGPSVTPDQNSVAVLIEHGGKTYRYLGCKGASLRFALATEQEVELTASLLGVSANEPSAETASPPAESGIYMEGDLGTLTMGGSAVNILGATFEVTIPLLGTDRKALGGSTLLEPQRHAAKTEINVSVDLELSNDTGNDTAAQVADYLAQTALGDIVVGPLTAASCYMTGDMPALQAGIQTFTINATAASLTLTTTA